MNSITCQVINRMTEFFAGQPKQIHHFLKVSAFCEAIAMGEKLDDALCQRLVIAGLVHDIGIRIADEKYGHHEGPLQEQEGPAPARELLQKIGLHPDDIERICWLVGHHHTYDPVEGIDHRILLEADYLVNQHEGQKDKEAARAAKESFFRTKTGIDLLEVMFDL